MSDKIPYYNILQHFAAGRRGQKYNLKQRRRNRPGGLTSGSSILWMELTFCVNFGVVREGKDFGKSLGDRGIKFLQKIYFRVGGDV